MKLFIEKSLALMLTLSLLVACSSGGSSSSPTPIPTPTGSSSQTPSGQISASWINTHLDKFLAKTTGNNNFSSAAISSVNNSTDYYLIVPNTTSPNTILLDYNIANNRWTNISYNLSSHNISKFIYYNNNLYAVGESSNLYKFIGSTWQQIPPSNGYNLSNVYSPGISGNASANLIAVATSEDLSKFIVLQLNNTGDGWTNITTTPLNIPANTSIANFSYYDNSWVVIFDDNDSDLSTMYLVGNNQPVAMNINDNNAGIADFANGIFLVESGNNIYTCNQTTCSQISGLPSGMMVGVTLFKTTLASDNGTVAVEAKDSTSFNYHTVDLSGNIKLYNCTLSGSTATCAQYGNTIQPLLQPPSSSNTVLPDVFEWMPLYVNDNSINTFFTGNFAISSLLTYFPTYGYGAYSYSNGNWNNIAPDFSSLISSQSYYELFTEQCINNSTTLFLLVANSVESLLNAQASIYTVNNGSSSWQNLTISGEPSAIYNLTTQGVTGITTNSLTNLPNMYFYHEPALCSEVY